jgi:molybdopterin converting factor small subunit
MATLIVPSGWAPSTQGHTRLSISGSSIRVILVEFAARYPDVCRRIFVPGGQALGSWINVFVQGEDIRERDGLDTSVRSDDTVLIVPAVAGG